MSAFFPLELLLALRETSSSNTCIIIKPVLKIVTLTQNVSLDRSSSLCNDSENFNFDACPTGTTAAPAAFVAPLQLMMLLMMLPLLPGVPLLPLLLLLTCCPCGCPNCCCCPACCPTAPLACPPVLATIWAWCTPLVAPSRGSDMPGPPLGASRAPQ